MASPSSSRGRVGVPNGATSCTCARLGEKLWDAVMGAGAKYDIRPVAPSEIRRIEAGILNYSSDIMLDNNPYEVGLGWTVDEDKRSDYLGKAALARMKNEGIKRKLVGVE